MHRGDDGDEDGEDPGTDDDRWWKGGCWTSLGMMDDGWSVNGSGGWRVDSRSPKNKKLRHKKTKSGIKGDLQDQ